MRIHFKILIGFFYMVFGCFLSAAEIDRPGSVAQPEILVKKKSEFWKSGHPDFGATNLRSAFNTLTGETLFVWKGFEYNGAVEGRILSGKGKTTTKKLAPLYSYCCTGLGVAFNPTNQEFLVVQMQDFAISGQRLNSQLKPVGNEFVIVPGGAADDSNYTPSVIFNPATGGYAVAWERNDGGRTPGDIAVALLDSAGKLTGSIVTVKKNPEANGFYDEWGVDCCSPNRILGFEYLPVADKLLLVFQQRFDLTQGDYWLATLNPTLQGFSSSSLNKINTKTVRMLNDGWTIQYAPSGRWGASLAITPDGSAFVYYGDEKSIKRRKIDSNGKPSGKALPAFSGPLKKAHLYDPRVVFSTISSGTTGLLIARIYDKPNPATLYGQALDSLGRPVGDPVLLDPADPGCLCNPTTALESALVALPRTASDKLFRFTYLFTHKNLDSGLGEILKINIDVKP